MRNQIASTGQPHVQKRLIFPACIWLVILLLFACPVSGFAEYQELDAVLDVKTNFSDGCSAVRELANVAQHRKVDVIIYSDHDKNSLEYGFWPLEKIIKKGDDHPSVLSNNMENYVSEILEGNKSFKEMIMIPAIESNPFYFWTGSYFDKNLTVNNWDKHLLIVGMQTAEDYEQIPILDGNFSTRYIKQKLNNFLLYTALFLACLLFVYKRIVRIVTIPLSLVCLALVYNNHPFPSSAFDAFHGDRGIKPYQDLIDYATARGGMVFWNDIESHITSKRGEVLTNTPPHPEDLFLSQNYTGFEAIFDEPIHATDPGKEWDRVLTQYIQGERKNPVWGYGGNAFHCEDKDNHKLGGTRTVLLATEKGPAAVLEAMLHGRMYAVRQPTEDNRLDLTRFSITDMATGQSSISGEELHTLKAPEIKVSLRSTKGDENVVKISVIRNGELVREESGTMPYEFTWRDTDVVLKGKAYYRIKASVESTHYLVSNPIFVQFSELPPQIASTTPVKTIPQKPASELKIPVPQPPTAPAAAVPPVVASPKTPIMAESEQEKTIASPKPPTISTPNNPEVKRVDSPESVEKKLATKPQVVIPRVDSVAIKKAPDITSSQIATINKGDRLTLVERTKVLYNDQPWLIVKKGNLTGYVWEPLVKIE